MGVDLPSSLVDPRRRVLTPAGGHNDTARFPGNEKAQAHRRGKEPPSWRPCALLWIPPRGLPIQGSHRHRRPRRRRRTSRAVCSDGIRKPVRYHVRGGAPSSVAARRPRDGPHRDRRDPALGASTSRLRTSWDVTGTRSSFRKPLVLRFAHDASPLPRQSLGTLDLGSETPVKFLPQVEVGLLELDVRAERQRTALVDESPEAGIVVVSPLIEAPSEKVLATVVLALLGVGQVSVARALKLLGRSRRPPMRFQYSWNSLLDGRIRRRDARGDRPRCVRSRSPCGRAERTRYSERPARNPFRYTPSSAPAGGGSVGRSCRGAESAHCWRNSSVSASSRSRNNPASSAAFLWRISRMTR